MLIKRFNQAWERERDQIESQLVEKLTEQIKEIDKSMNNMTGYHAEEDKFELSKLRNELILRRSMAIYESEDIARNRMQMRTSYLAVFMSSVALIISVLTVLFNINA